MKLRFADELDEVVRRPSTTMIFGMIGSGKTALGYKLMEIAHRTNSQAAMFVQSYSATIGNKLQALLPDYLEVTTETDMAKLPKSCYVLRDEAWRFANSKRHPKRDEAIATAADLALVRQRGQHELILIQNLANLDVDYFRFGCNLVLKWTSLESIATERQEMKDIILGPYQGFIQRIVFEEIDPLRLFYVRTPNTPLYEFQESHSGGYYTTGLPSFWSEQISTIWSEVSCLT